MKFLGKMCLKDNIKSHKKPRFHPLFRRHIFRKTTGGGVKWTPSRFRVMHNLKRQKFHSLCTCSAAYSGSCYPSKMEHFAKTVNSEQPLTIYAKNSFSDV